LGLIGGGLGLIGVGLCCYAGVGLGLIGGGLGLIGIGLCYVGGLGLIGGGLGLIGVGLCCYAGVGLGLIVSLGLIAVSLGRGLMAVSLGLIAASGRMSTAVVGGVGVVCPAFSGRLNCVISCCELLV
jgi:hypothetical protein